MLTEENKINLDKLATYLEHLPVDYAAFQMSQFFRPRDDYENFRDREKKYALENGGVGQCGAIACAVGHGPSAGVLFTEDQFVEDSYFDEKTDSWKDYTRPNWSAYSNQFVSRNTAMWEYLFGGTWSRYDDSHRGAAARIRYVLDGHVPNFANMYDQQARLKFYSPTAYQKYLVS